MVKELVFEPWTEIVWEYIGQNDLLKAEEEDDSWEKISEKNNKKSDDSWCISYAGMIITEDRVSDEEMADFWLH